LINKESGKMKKTVNQKIKYKTAALLLVMCCLFSSLVGCGEKKPIKQEGIAILPTGEYTYSDASREKMARAVFNLLEYYFKKTVMPTLPEATRSELSGIADEIAELSQNKLISEKNYLATAEAIEAYGIPVAEELAAMRAGTGGDMKKTKELYLAVSTAAGANYVGRVLYDSLCYLYSYRYEKSMARYEKFKFPYLLEEASAHEAKLNTLREGIGIDDFTTVMELGFMFSELYASDATVEKLSAFSDEEVAALIKHVKISRLQISPGGWELIFSYITPSAKPSDYKSALIYAAVQNGDLAALAENMAGFIEIAHKAQSGLKNEDVALLRSGKKKELISQLLGRFDDNDWASLENLLNSFSSAEDYNNIAKEFFGDEYLSYAAGIKAVTLAELRAAVGTEEFFEKMEGYIAGISPALSYGYIYDISKQH
jgi:hypothetical protein